jgi:hypothetical protein
LVIPDPLGTPSKLIPMSVRQRVFLNASTALIYFEIRVKTMSRKVFQFCSKAQMAQSCGEEMIKGEIT